VEEAIHFAPGRALRYALRLDPRADALRASYETDRVVVGLPELRGRAWATGDEVGMSAEQQVATDRTLLLLIEKDFKCLAPRPGEEAYDGFPNPGVSHDDCDPDAGADKAFRFGKFEDLADGDVFVRIEGRNPAEPERGHVPAYECAIHRRSDGVRVGLISVRIGSTPWLDTFAGHLGYNVDPEHRGHRYAAEACRAIRPIARFHGMSRLWITTTPDNVASRRTCEILGAELVEIVDLPPGNDMYDRGERHKCRYLWAIDRAP
jgi:predicted acetyltransferase